MLEFAMLLGCRFDNPDFEGGAESTSHASSTIGTTTIDLADDVAEENSADDLSDSSDQSSSADSGDPQGFCTVFRENLIACYEFEEINNDTITDGSSYGNHIHVSQTGLSPSGYWGNALESTDTSEAFTPDSEIFNVEGFTLAVALYPHMILADVDNGVFDNDLQYALFIRGNKVLCHDGNRLVMTDAPALNQWTRIVCTSDQKTLRIYVEGVLVDELTPLNAARDDNMNPISIGNMSPEFDSPFIGLIDNMRIWNRALTQDEVGDLEG